MKALVVQERGGPFVMEQRPDPVAGAGEVVVWVLACGMGLTIQHTRMGRGPGVKFPLIIGHESAAEVVEVGAGVDPEALKVGDAVTCYFYITCGHCKWCRINRPPLCANFKGYVGRQIDGAYAEYMKAPASCFIRLPAGLDYKQYPGEVAVICDAVATPYKVLRRTRLAPLERVAVIDARGGVGMHMVMMARWAHAQVIAVDVVDEKLDKCREVGAHATVNATDGRMTEALLDLTGGNGVDVVWTLSPRPKRWPTVSKPSVRVDDWSPSAVVGVPRLSRRSDGTCSPKNWRFSAAATARARRCKTPLNWWRGATSGRW
jgi:propanol-preferring alcohol dehydrogenase